MKVSEFLEEKVIPPINDGDGNPLFSIGQVTEAIKIAREEEIERLGKNFCDLFMHESLECAMSRTRSMSCRDKCPMYNNFINNKKQFEL